MLKFVDSAICRLGMSERSIWVSPVGCGGLTDSYLSISHILAAHGRASAVATSVKRLHPEALVIVSQGDGDLASIGFLEALHAANRGENITVFFMNNANFAMTGGQMAPTTLLGRCTATTPQGRSICEQGAPLHVCEILNTLDGPSYIARVALGTEKQIAETERVIARALENQVQQKGYSFVEILSPCPSNWHCSAAEARDYVAREMTREYPLGVFRDVSHEDRILQRSRGCAYHPDVVRDAYLSLARPVDSAVPGILSLPHPISVCCAGFGGQGILTMGRQIAHVALRAGLEATWIPSYGPEMRGGVANCFVRMSQGTISSPIVSRPDYVLAMNQPALESFLPRLTDDGTMIYDRDAAQSEAEDERLCGIPATSLAVAHDCARSANLVLLGAWLRRMGSEEDVVLGALGGELSPGQGAALRAGFRWPDA